MAGLFFRGLTKKYFYTIVITAELCQRQPFCLIHFEHSYVFATGYCTLQGAAGLSERVEPELDGRLGDRAGYAVGNNADSGLEGLDGLSCAWAIATVHV